MRLVQNCTSITNGRGLVEYYIGRSIKSGVLPSAELKGKLISYISPLTQRDTALWSEYWKWFEKFFFRKRKKIVSQYIKEIEFILHNAKKKCFKSGTCNHLPRVQNDFKHADKSKKKHADNTKDSMNEISFN